MPKLIFIYGSNAGLLHDARSSWQKLIGRDCDCSLCAITHGLATEKREWKEFRESLSVPAEFLHADEVPPQLRETLPHIALPVVLVQTSSATRVLVNSAEIAACENNPVKLIDLLRARLPNATPLT